jgi:hypothetical protein
MTEEFPPERFHVVKPHGHFCGFAVLRRSSPFVRKTTVNSLSTDELSRETR